MAQISEYYRIVTFLPIPTPSVKLTWEGVVAGLCEGPGGGEPGGAGLKQTWGGAEERVQRQTLAHAVSLHLRAQQHLSGSQAGRQSLTQRRPSETTLPKVRGDTLAQTAYTLTRKQSLLCNSPKIFQGNSTQQGTHT